MNIKPIEEFTLEECSSYLSQDADSEVGKLVLAHMLRLIDRGEHKPKPQPQPQPKPQPKSETQLIYPHPCRFIRKGEFLERYPIFKRYQSDTLGFYEIEDTPRDFKIVRAFPKKLGIIQFSPSGELFVRALKKFDDICYIGQNIYIMKADDRMGLLKLIDTRRGAFMWLKDMDCCLIRPMDGGVEIVKGARVEYYSVNELLRNNK